MKRDRITRLICVLAILITIGSLSMPSSTTAADPCGRENQVSCIERSLQELNDCFNRYGSTLGEAMCQGVAEETYQGCMILKGCASPPPPLM